MISKERLAEIWASMALPSPFERKNFEKRAMEILPNLSSGSLSWLFYELLKSSLIERVGPSTYAEKGALPVYQGGVKGKRWEEVSSLLSARLSRTKGVIFEVSSLNAFLNHLIAHETLIVEVERNAMESAFWAIKEKWPKENVLLNPTGEEMARYGGEDEILVLPLTKRFPAGASPYSMGMEKLLVDLFADKGLRQFFDESEIPGMVKEMKGGYYFERKALLSYARQRGVTEKIEEALNQKG